MLSADFLSYPWYSWSVISCYAMSISCDNSFYSSDLLGSEFFLPKVNYSIELMILIKTKIGYLACLCCPCRRAGVPGGHTLVSGWPPHITHAGDMTSQNSSYDITHIRDMKTQYSDNVIIVLIITFACVLFFISILINVTIVIIHIKTPSLRTISNR